MNKVVRLLAAITALVTSGCGPAGPDNCHNRVSYPSNQVAPSGLKLRATQDPYITFSDMEKAYWQTQQCVGVTTTGPEVAYIDLKTAGYANYATTWGLAQLNTGIIVVNTYIQGRSCETDVRTLKHEFVHYLLHAAGFPVADNEAHNSPLFTLCTT